MAAIFISKWPEGGVTVKKKYINDCSVVYPPVGSHSNWYIQICNESFYSHSVAYLLEGINFESWESFMNRHQYLRRR